MPRPVNWFLVLASICLAACFLRPGRGLKSCRYGFRSLAFVSVDKDRTSWRVDMDVVNPNSHPVTLERMRFVLLHEKDTLVTGWNPFQRQVPAGDSLVLETVLEVPHGVWQRLPAGVTADPEARFDLIGDAYLQTWLGEIHVPGALKKTLRVNMPEQLTRIKAMFLRSLFPWSGGPSASPRFQPPRGDAPPDIGPAPPPGLPGNDTL